MSTALALSMLYEVLVAESKYESRGSEYRAKLKDLYHQMLREHRAYKDFPQKFAKQSSNKFVESLSDSVTVLDPTEVQPTDLELCYGIHQYVFPKIPDFDQLDSNFVAKWHKFYNGLPLFYKASDRKTKRTGEKQKNYPMSKRRNTRDSESSSDSDQHESKTNQPVLLTEEDLENPKTASKSEKTFEKVEDPGANPPEPSEPEVHLSLPIALNKEVEVNEDAIVFGLMDDSKLGDWVSTCSFESYKQLYEQIYFYDQSLKMYSKQDLEPSRENRDSTKDATFQLHPEFGKTSEKDPELEPPKVYSEAPVKVEKDNTSSSSSSSQVSEQLLSKTDFYKESKPKTLPGTHRQNTDNFDPNYIFGNYYCPVNTSENKEEEQTQVNGLVRKRGRPPKKKKPLPNTSTTTMVDSTDKSDSSSNKFNTNPDSQWSSDTNNKTTPDNGNVMNLKNFTVNFMEVDSTYSCNNSGSFEVRCSATINDPFVSGFMKGKMEVNMGVYQELQLVLKRLFSLKKKVSGNCPVCSGWNLLHGIAMTFCESCEGKLLNSDKDLLLKIFEIRRYLVSNLYPIVGYNFQTLNLFKDGELVKNWKDLLKTQKVSIQSLTRVGASFPKASLHDSRYLPSPTMLPLTICDTINTFQYPKSNVTLSASSPKENSPHSSRDLTHFSKDDPKTPVSTPARFDVTVNAFSNQALNSSSSFNSSFKGSNSGSNREVLNSEGKAHKDADRSTSSNPLLEMARYRRYNRAKGLNDFFEDIFNSYHSKTPDQRSTLLVNNYVNVLKNGLLPSTEFNPPSESEDSDEEDSDSEDSSESSEDNEKAAKKDAKRDKKHKDADGNGAKKDKYSRENYFDEQVSFLLSRLPLDTDLIQHSFYHRGIYLCMPNNPKAYSFVDVGKFFGFNEALCLQNSPSNKGSSKASVASAGDSQAVSTPDDSGNLPNGETEQSQEEVPQENTTSDLSSVSFAYNWHEVLWRNLSKRPQLASSRPRSTEEFVKTVLNQPDFPDNKEAAKRKEMFRLLHKCGLLQNMPFQILNNLYNTGKLEIGFPTSLGMHVLNIPDSIMDCSMYGGVGKGLLYSLDAVLRNLAILSPFLKVGTVGTKRKKHTRSTQN